jgi:hypothetical protein
VMRPKKCRAFRHLNMRVCTIIRGSFIATGLSGGQPLQRQQEWAVHSLRP